jgi:hypothetical protein
MGPIADTTSNDPRKRIQAEVGFGPNPDKARAHYACAADYEYDHRHDADIDEGDERRQLADT